MSGHDELPAATAANYRAFAAEASGRSPQYAELAPGAAGEARRTQTNEPARCATLLPALSMLPLPLALIEVGASAGLTLLPDKYSYDYDGHQVTGTDPRAPVLGCQPRGPVPLPAQVPEVAWRAGLDLNPLDVTRADDVRWLRCLLWPGETGRLERLSAAIDPARRDPPALYRGDLLTDVPGLVSQAPRGATVVICHPAVTSPPAGDHGFVLVRDGVEAIAITDAHGTWVEWVG